MLVFTIIAGIIISILFLISSRQNRRVNIYLSFYFLILSVYAIIRYLVLYSNNPFLIAIGTHNFSFLFLLPGPLFYFYVRAVLYRKTGLSIKDTIHFIPAILHLLALIPWLLTPFSAKMEMARAIIIHPDRVFYIPNIDFVLPPFVNYTLRLLSVISYIIYSLYITIRYEGKFLYPLAKMKEVVNGFQLLYLFMTLQFLMYLLYLISVFIGTSTNLGGLSSSAGSVFSVVLGINLMLQVFMITLFPFLLYGLPARLLHEYAKDNAM